MVLGRGGGLDFANFARLHLNVNAKVAFLHFGLDFGPQFQVDWPSLMLTGLVSG